MNALLRAKDVTKTYEKAQHPSLNNISFSVAAGEFIGIMGASGSGKTTLLNVLSTIDTPTSGEIWINGINIRQLDNTGAADFRKDHLGFIFQEYFLLDSLTIRENISVPLTLQKLPPPPQDRNNGAKSCGAFRYRIAARQISGRTFRQRASAARAIIKKPSILFADEPTGALDSSAATELLHALQEANQELHTTILMVTHDAYAASFAGRILIFKDGNITREIFRNNADRHGFYESIAAEVARLDTER